MIQELFGGGETGVLIGGSADQRSSNNPKFPAIPGGVALDIHGSSSQSPSAIHPLPSLSPASSSSSAVAASSSSSENLRCPRCDSSNTKFCYYNNYNLTQPRHFCKTCRRYWTKGGALRNVPIGGGCRKNKPATSITTSAGKTSIVGKLKSAGSNVPSEIGKAGIFGGLERDLSSNPILWASSQNSHLLSLLRGNYNFNPNPNPNPSLIMNPALNLKEEGLGYGSHMTSASESHLIPSAPPNAPPILGLDPLSSPSLWKNINGVQNQLHGNHQPSQRNGIVLGEAQVQSSSSGAQGVYERLRSSLNRYSDHYNVPVLLGDVASSSSSSPSASTTILDSAPIAAGGDQVMGYWNPSLSAWPDLSTTNGAYP